MNRPVRSKSGGRKINHGPGKKLAIAQPELLAQNGRRRANHDGSVDGMNSIQHEEFLLGIAQIAVTLAGFSGLVVAIRGASPTDWHRRDIWSLSWMFGSSLGALFLTLLPLLLISFRLHAGLVWTVASLAMCAFMIVFA